MVLERQLGNSFTLRFVAPPDQIAELSDQTMEDEDFFAVMLVPEGNEFCLC